MESHSSPHSKWLAEQLVARGWGISEFADRASVPYQTAWRWVKKGNVPDSQFWPGIGIALGYSVSVIGNVMRGFPVSESAVTSAIESQLDRALEQQATLLQGILDVRSVAAGVTIPIVGYIPADTVRWTSGGQFGEVDILQSDLRGARDPYALIATGDCMMRAGIVSGTIVILEPPNGRKPRDGQIVAVRVNTDEYTLKRWVVAADEIQLHDGDGNIVYHVNPLDEVDVIGFYVTHKPAPTE